MRPSADSIARISQHMHPVRNPYITKISSRNVRLRSASLQAVYVFAQDDRQRQTIGVLFDTPVDGATHGDATERLERPRTGADRPHTGANVGAALAGLELLLNRGANAGDARLQMAPAERHPEHV